MFENQCKFTAVRQPRDHSCIKQKPMHHTSKDRTKDVHEVTFHFPNHNKIILIKNLKRVKKDSLCTIRTSLRKKTGWKMNSNWNRISLEELIDKITFLCFKRKKSFQISYLVSVSYLEKKSECWRMGGKKNGVKMKGCLVKTSFRWHQKPKIFHPAEIFALGFYFLWTPGRTLQSLSLVCC